MDSNTHTISDLYQYQALPLNLKIAMTKRRIRDWVNYFGESGVYVSFSGGKDSTVLLHIAREMYPHIKAMFVDTGLEYSEIRSFVRTWDNVDIIRPKISFKKVCEKYGFPLISKEVSEAVYGARKYLTSILAENSLAQTDRQTDRQTEPPYRYFYNKVTGTGAYQNSQRREKASEPVRSGKNSWNSWTEHPFEKVGGVR